MLRFKIALCLILGAMAVNGLPGTARAETAATIAPLNVRTGPGLDNPVVDTLFRGERVMVHLCEEFWCQITHSGPDGWVAAGYLTQATSTEIWRAASRSTGADYIPDNAVASPGINIDVSLERPARCPTWRRNCI